MDYYFIDPQNINNLSKKNGTIDFNFVPQEDVNFFEASLVIKMDYAISKNNPIMEFPENSPIQNINKFFIYNILQEAVLTSNKKRIAKQEYIHDYVRTSHIFRNDPRDSLYGFTPIKCKNFTCSDSLYFNIPLRLIFSEFVGLNYVDSETKNLSIKLKEIDCNVLDKYQSNLTFDYSFKSITLKIPKYLSNIETTENPGIVFQDNSNCQSIESIVKARRGDIDCLLTTDRPLSFICMFKNHMNEIQSGIKSVRLMINNELIPSIDSDEETSLEHYYEMYLRYIDYTYGCSVHKHEKNMNVMNFSEFSENPIFFFILPKIREVSQYSIKLKISFVGGTETNSLISQIYYRSNFLAKQGEY